MSDDLPYVKFTYKQMTPTELAAAIKGVNASKYTLNDIRYLGLTEIFLGLVALVFLEYSLLFWAIGFGLVHIIYGIVMYYKYERLV